ncbi:hypothetical protein V8G54_013029 [Vigna mungo]|uniref:Uncharacterized protein n=1 Tax=Vigna mungo TaxID=3915 RepID=A0AAQ3NTZ4_VIGMU
MPIPCISVGTSIPISLTAAITSSLTPNPSKLATTFFSFLALSFSASATAAPLAFFLGSGAILAASLRCRARSLSSSKECFASAVSGAAATEQSGRKRGRRGRGLRSGTRLARKRVKGE